MHDDFHHSPTYHQYAHNDALTTLELQIERKFFKAQIRENERGKFLRLTEESQGRRNTVIVPSSGFGEFAQLINEILATEAAKS